MKRLQLLLLCLLWSGGSGLPQSSKRQPHQQQDQQPGMLPPPPPQALPPPPPQALPPQPIQSPPPGSQQSQLPFNGPQQVRPKQSDQFAQPGSFQHQNLTLSHLHHSNGHLLRDRFKALHSSLRLDIVSRILNFPRQSLMRRHSCHFQHRMSHSWPSH